MTETVWEQILDIRNSSITNMFDISRVQREAYDRRFHELVLYIEENKDEYVKFILTGEYKA
jgi:hypothetical protein